MKALINICEVFAKMTNQFSLAKFYALRKYDTVCYGILFFME